MSKLVIANEEEAVAAAWPSPIVPPLIPGICVVTLASVVNAPSETLRFIPVYVGYLVILKIC